MSEKKVEVSRKTVKERKKCIKKLTERLPTLTKMALEKK